MYLFLITARAQYHSTNVGVREQQHSHNNQFSPTFTEFPGMEELRPPDLLNEHLYPLSHLAGPKQYSTKEGPMEVGQTHVK